MIKDRTQHVAEIGEKKRQTKSNILKKLHLNNVYTVAVANHSPHPL